MRSANAVGVVSLCEHAGGSAAALMAGKYKMKSDTVCPIGVSNTDRFIDSICNIMGLDIPDSIERDRGRLLDAMADVHQTNYGKKAARQAGQMLLSAIFIHQELQTWTVRLIFSILHGRSQCFPLNGHSSLINTLTACRYSRNS